MRQKKGLIILVVILLALCGVYFGLKSYNKSQAKKEDQKEKEKTIQVLDIENPVEITYSADDGSSMSFVKEDGTWYLKNDKETALVQDTIQDIADTVSDVKAEKQIKDPDPLESYGLNEASYTIIVTDGKRAGIVFFIQKHSGRRMPPAIIIFLVLDNV